MAQCKFWNISVYTNANFGIFKAIEMQILEWCIGKTPIPFRASGKKIVLIGANFNNEIRNIDEWVAE